MFDKVSQAYIDVYDRETNRYLGRHVFKITPEIERILLEFARNELRRDRIVVQDVLFTPASEDYVVPTLYSKLRRRGIIRGMFRDQYSQQWIPVEIRVRIDVRGRTHRENGQILFDSVEYSDIVVEEIKVMAEYILDPERQPSVSP